MITSNKYILILAFIFISLTSFSQGFLRVDGKTIKDGQGREIILRGMGLGGWMLQEPYMLQLHGAAINQSDFRAKLEKLTGKENVQHFYDAWLEGFTTKADIDSMAKWGFNSVRLPMHYNLYTLPVWEEKDSTQNTFIEKGFALTDSLLAWCKANRLYLILDLHAAPGAQGNDIPISDRDTTKPNLWASVANKNKTIALWTELAKRYANEEWIGGYDLLNETNFGFTDPKDINGCNEKDNAELRKLLIDITKAIRAVDKNHIIFIEGNCWANNYNGIFPLWDNNLVVSFHKYWNYNNKESIANFLKIRDEHNVPLWLGETGENSNVWFTDAIRLMEEHKIGWAWWPLKKMGANNPLQIKQPAGYRELVQHLRDGKGNFSAEKVNDILKELAKAARIENNIVRYDVIDAMFRQVQSDAAIPYANNQLDKQLLLYAVNYDYGRMGIAYHDNDAGNYWVSTTKRTQWNKGGQYRNDGVDIGTCDDSLTNGYSVGWTENGEWLQYTLYVSNPGWYTVKVRAKNTSAQAGALALAVNNKKPETTVTLKGAANKWTTTPAGKIWLAKGENRLKLTVKKGGFDLNYLELALDASAATKPASAK